MSRVVVDTSVWSLALRRAVEHADPQHQRLQEMLREQRSIVMLGVILQEILQGIRDPLQFENVRNRLAVFPLLTLEADDYIAAAELWNECRSQGIQASTTDFQIAAACIRHDCELLTTDKDFLHISRVCPLQLL